MNEFGVHYPELPPLPKPPTLDERNVEAAEISARATQQATQIAQQSLSVAEDSLTAASWIGWTTFGVTLAAAVLAGLALSAWRAQMYGEHQYTSAVAALKTLRNMRNLMREHRKPLKTRHQSLDKPGTGSGQATQDELSSMFSAEGIRRVQQEASAERQRVHTAFATQLAQERDHLEETLVGLEPQWGTAFTTLVDRVIKRIEAFAQASQLVVDLQVPANRQQFLDAQAARTSTSEQSDAGPRALLWMGFPSKDVENHESELIRVLKAEEEIFKPLTDLEYWLNQKISALIGKKFRPATNSKNES